MVNQLEEAGVFFAHSVRGKPYASWQALSEHLRRVAALAQERGDKFGAGKAAYLAGLFHDLGKYTEGFLKRLHDGPPVDHSTAGAQQVLEEVAAADRLIADLLAYAIAGHHTGLPDRRGNETSHLDQRLKKELPPLAAIWRKEIGELPSGLAPEGFTPLRERAAFQLSMLGRFLFSCLVDADFRDTEAFYAQANGEEVDRAIDHDLRPLRDKLDARLTELQAKAEDTAVNRRRREILSAVRSRAGDAPGLFSLTVPTGGGKTLASLAFALDHAVTHGLDRVIYAIPFTSIIEQTAGTFREILGQDVVLEHHSNLDEARLSDAEGKDKLRLAMEDWAAPVIVTTNVQLFESLFANRPSRCRKLHNLARSVIVLDEVQALPLHLLSPSVAAMDELARNYGTSLVLCTATQPALEAPDFKGGLTGVRELAPAPAELERSFRRVRFEQREETSDAEIVAALAETPQALVIVNTRAHALDLYRAAQEAGLSGLVHLTTRLTAFDRRPLLDRIRKDLKGEKPCRVIATSLVEAGVDLDFPQVWRAEAGLDSILQAAGRCNREGKRLPEASRVTIFRPADHPPPRSLKPLVEATRRTLAQHPDPAELAAITTYFKEVYWQRGFEGFDEKKIMACFQAGGQTTNLAYRSVAEAFRLIDDRMEPVIVERDAISRDAIAALPYAQKTGGLARTLQPYLVQVPPAAREALLKHGRVCFADAEQQFAVLQDLSLYDEALGLIWEDAEELKPSLSVM